MRKFLAVFALPLIWLVYESSYAQLDIEKVALDSMMLGEYKAVLYEIRQAGSGEDGETAEELRITKDGKPSMSTVSKTVSLYNFGTVTEESKGSYYKDINNDGIDEIIVMGHTGLGSCCNHMSIHGLGGEVISEIGRLELRDLDVFILEDIDKDSIPEILIRDAHFLRWKAPFDDSPKPLLIWKWQNGGYRLANYKFADYLLDRIGMDEYRKLEKAIKKRIDKEYDPTDEFKQYPPPELWGLMLDYIYAGQFAGADSVFEKYWPEEIPGKNEFYDEFKKHLESGIYWKGIENSNF